MPEISVRGMEMPESPIRKLAPLANAAKKRGMKVYHLNIGQPDLPTPKVALEAIRNIDRKVLEYSPSQGYQSYREKLVGYYAKYNIDVTADDIIITGGGSEAVLFSFLSCLNPGDEIIFTQSGQAIEKSSQRNYRISFSIIKNLSGSLNSCTVKIFNLDLEAAQSLMTYGTHLS